MAWTCRSAPRALLRDHVAGEVGQQAAQPVGLAGVVEHAAAAHEGEVLGAGLLDALLVLGDLGVELVELDLVAVDAAEGVAPLGEHVAGVEELLVEARGSAVADVGHGAEADGVGREADGALARCRRAGRGRSAHRVGDGPELAVDRGSAGRRRGVRRVPGRRRSSTEPRLQAAATVIMTPATATAMNRLRVRPTQHSPWLVSGTGPCGTGSLDLIESESRTRSSIASTAPPVGAASG